MNKKILLMGALAIALAVAGGYGVKASMNSQSHFSDLVLANTEALAFLEAPNSGIPCHSSIRIETKDPNENVWLFTSCVSCEHQPGFEARDAASCKPRGMWHFAR